MVEHTKGPWQLWPTHWAGGSGHRGLYIEQIDGSKSICDLVHHGPDVSPDEEDYANAALIAAAPDLLAALKAVEWIWVNENWMCPWCQGYRDYDGHTRICPRQRALERARGTGTGEE